MLKLTNTMKNAALATALGTALLGSAAVTLVPLAANAQIDRDDRFARDRDVRFHRDWDDRFHRNWDDRGWYGVGVPWFGVGFYDYPAYPYYGPYCSSYDYDYGYCSY